eukprot:TRINITY_DN1232_c0_g2_i1.p1 TRINITY_DN1232_c0_g2~~TRINITY_DN1232_c0_g2_i1.p1  ORF type:complete len:328 (-),score=39.83 TRINITY_DN1232_c0_g2_i1:70-1053(-)
MKFTLIFGLCLLSFVCVSSSTVNKLPPAYALNFELGGWKGADYQTWVVRVNETNPDLPYDNIVKVITNYYPYIFSLQVAALDIKRNILYFVLNFYSSYIFAVDLNEGTNLGIISIEALFIPHIHFDQIAGELYIDALYEVGYNIFSEQLIVVNDEKHFTKQLLNFTIPNLHSYAAFTALDYVNKMYYLYSYNSMDNQTMTYYSLVDPNKYANYTIKCSPWQNLAFLAFDYAINQLIGFGIYESGNLEEYYFVKFDIQSETCESTLIPQLTIYPGCPFTFDFNPVDEILYMVTQQELIIYDVKTTNVTINNMYNSFFALKVPYTPPSL